ncbi:MAG: hypothetical protein QOJ64_3735 [Acidobacteriota bacterium]|jgi:chromosome segregation ATPase|nr:hypothetical protein [Acidobacteriota bacterium]
MVEALSRDGLREEAPQAAPFRSQAEEHFSIIGGLEDNRGKGASQGGRLQRQVDQQIRLLERLKNHIKTASVRRARTCEELLDARWEVLTLRGILVRPDNSIEKLSARCFEMERLGEAARAERDHLRTMLVSLQNILEQERITGRAEQDRLWTQLRSATENLRSAEKQIERLKEKVSRKGILLLGTWYRRLRQLVASRIRR